MAVPTIFSALLIIIIISSSSSATFMNSTPHPRNQNLIMAIEEMQKANYFTFVMLINMSPIGLFLDNVTFLMPNDRTLSETMIPGYAVSEFLKRHAVPSPLLIDHLLHIPTGSVLPSLEPGFSLTVSNHGRRNFSINNVRIISPNICFSGYSIRCHGVDGVMQKMVVEEEANTSCSSRTSTNCSCDGSCHMADQAAPPTTSMPPLQLPSGLASGLNPPTAVAAPPPSSDKVDPQKSGSSGGISCGGLLELVGMSCCIMLLML
ncbi:hypothetical protein PVL29_020619 [Vitis rotundifolia]|uniref:FAS1 domain-containing protein n=1 Tax=Vitis rotundifolia TaxID=103349 RepID=A0AA38YXV4_VITRO|nr:hypothetical protein PVL29_020619 [Vitis rotundifolia]